MTRLAAVLVVLVALANAAPALASAEPAAVDVAVTVSFDKQAYLAYEEITATLVVTNNGTAPANRVTLVHDTNGPFQPDQWHGFAPDTGGMTLQPGERVVWPIPVRLQTLVDVLRLSFEAHTSDPETDTANNTASAEAVITARTADVVGTLYGDRDGDRQFDQGEALSGVLVQGNGGMPYGEFTTRTDAGGRFVAEDVPEGSYALTLSLPGGWQQDESAIVDAVVGGEPALVRATRDSSALRGSITFDKGTYHVGEVVHERVTLTNTSGTDLSGVTARCVEGAGPNTLSGLGWGDLVHYEAAGVAVRAGETRTWDFTDVVPSGGHLYGFITITCWFSTAFRYDDGPAVTARAEVPGGRGSTGGVLYVDRDEDAGPDPGEAVPDVKVYLVDGTGAIVARTRSDATGHFLFRDLPANQYAMRLVGPWRARGGVDVRLSIFADAFMGELAFAVEPGPNQLDIDAPAPGAVPTGDVPPEPVPQASAVPHPPTLADTGADVAELTAFGFLLLVVGMLLVSRRKRFS
ncbi:LPXTG cell wall anchor domain-containing protein [Actinophytocola oryzae]|uniref:LPXTG-motif cell wall-anchored protein n=1 Tax=Actinophytocola oryzae TaxID=502181 RepID=A0A4R7UX96_9PSEU|nr:LPXTG cell wall anchor domain-containing protein [Actinophytocola oryzae]TDV40145.1 LPXTG-motif cell wall-anchored protein [Actinophytocola oryzae]